ncbi:MAG: DNA polymerase-3 subunit epsilon, partial [Pseudohongiellaceae bacterium]
EILADVYLLLSGGQSALLLDKDEGGGVSAIQRIPADRQSLSVIKANDIELEAHNRYMSNLGKKTELVSW